MSGSHEQPAVRLINLCKSYDLAKHRRRTLKERVGRHRHLGGDVFRALDMINLTIPKGHFHGIVGPNGGGKSTTLKMIAKIQRPSSGTVEVNGSLVPLLELGAGFHHDLTGSENLDLNARLLGLDRSTFREMRHQIVEFAGIGDFIDLPVKLYSSGMYARLGFAAAVHTGSSIVLVDEVLSVGDQAFRNKCLNRFAELHAAGTTIIVVSHDIDFLLTIADSISWIEGGKLRATGVPTQVIAAYRASLDNITPEPDSGSAME